MNWWVTVGPIWSDRTTLPLLNLFPSCLHYLVLGAFLWAPTLEYMSADYRRLAQTDARLQQDQHWINLG